MRLAAASLVAGAATPAILRWLRRTGSARRSVDMRMTVVVERPLNEVFDFCRDFENFPKIVDVLLSVEDTQDGRSHWAVRSPKGDAIEWDAVVSKYVPNSVIAWESVPGSIVRAGGVMRFYPLSAKETRLDLALTYQPLRTGLNEALHAMMTRPNATRIQGELNKAARQISATAG